MAVEASPIRIRSQAERDAYMAGQRAALDLAREKGIDYAEQIIGVAQRSVQEATRS